MDDTPLPFGLRIKVADRFYQANTGITDYQLHALEAALFQMPEKPAPAGFILPGAFPDAKNPSVALGIDSDGDKDRYIADLLSPC
jgi:hypothetical protein